MVPFSPPNKLGLIRQHLWRIFEHSKGTQTPLTRTILRPPRQVVSVQFALRVLSHLTCLVRFNRTMVRFL